MAKEKSKTKPVKQYFSSLFKWGKKYFWVNTRRNVATVICICGVLTTLGMWSGVGAFAYALFKEGELFAIFLSVISIKRHGIDGAIGSLFGWLWWTGIVIFLYILFTPQPLIAPNCQGPFGLLDPIVAIEHALFPICMAVVYFPLKKLKAK